LYLTDINRS